MFAREAYTFGEIRDFVVRDIGLYVVCRDQALPSEAAVDGDLGCTMLDFKT
jgi:hypothetical protein